MMISEGTLDGINHDYERQGLYEKVRSGKSDQLDRYQNLIKIFGTQAYRIRGCLGLGKVGQEKNDWSKIAWDTGGWVGPILTNNKFCLCSVKFVFALQCAIFIA